MLDTRRDICYNYSILIKSRLDIMYDYDSTNIWDYEISCHDYLDETYAYNMQNTYDLDDDHPRDNTDYQALAYRHYA
jgi:hypothetical protein